jgi:thiamine biosynthesis lipoprotein
MTAAFMLAERLEGVFSFFDPQSELSALNRCAEGEWKPVSTDLEEVLRLGARIEKASGGAFRLMPSCVHGAGACHGLEAGRARKLSPCVFDLGGVAKGYVVDRAYALLAAALPDGNLSVNAGGDLRIRGAQAVEIRVPRFDGPELQYRVDVPSGAAMATSSVIGAQVMTGVAAAKYVGKASGGIATATVFADSCAVADALTKAALFGGAIQLLESEFEARIMKFASDGEPL